MGIDGNDMKSYVLSCMYKASTGITQAIFVTIGIGILFESIGKLMDLNQLVIIGTVSKVLMAPAIGCGIAYMLGASGLVVFAAMVASAFGGGAIQAGETGIMIVSGEPVGAILAGLFAVYIGKRITGETPFDLMAVPILSIGISSFVGIWLANIIQPILTAAGGFIMDSASGSPLWTTVIVAVIWGMLLISPASSSALAIALNLEGIAGGAALAGCAAQFAGMAFISIKENDLGGFLAQVMCTPTIQFPNITKNPYIILPTVAASAVAGPIAVLYFGLEVTKEVAGMGLSSFVAPITILAESDSNLVIIPMLISYVLIPAIISGIIAAVLKKKKLIKPGDFILPE